MDYTTVRISIKNLGWLKDLKHDYRVDSIDAVLDIIRKKEA